MRFSILSYVLPLRSLCSLMFKFFPSTTFYERRTMNGERQTMNGERRTFRVHRIPEIRQSISRDSPFGNTQNGGLSRVATWSANDGNTA